MTSRHRIVTWNCRRAKADSGVWKYLSELAPDIALLQEVSSLPDTLRQVYAVQAASPRNRHGRPQKFQTVLLVRGHIDATLALPALSDWVATELQLFAGNLPAACVTLVDGKRLSVVCVYSPAWPIDRARLNGIDVSGVKLTQNPDVWVSDLLWASLNHLHPGPFSEWIIAGDFNSSETFDQWRDGPRGNREYLDRMASLGLVECLRQAQGKLSPTFRNPRGGAIVHQMDHLFVTQGMATRLIHCETGSQTVVFDGGLSDHLPIIADFEP
jgi:endonuclease/exonuclease/phosphatase family metal-dependent hydrolase